MTADEFDSLRRGDVVRWDDEGILGLVIRHGKKEVAVLWEDKACGGGTVADAPHMTVIATAKSAADQ